MRILLVLAMIGLAVPAQAKKGKKAEQAAKKHFERGAKLFQKQQYAEAIKAFEAAWSDDPRPEYLYTKAQAERMGGDCDAAIATYNRYLGTKDKKYGPHARENIKRCKSELEAKATPPASETKPEVATKEPEAKPEVATKESGSKPTSTPPPAAEPTPVAPPAEPPPAAAPTATPTPSVEEPQPPAAEPVPMSNIVDETTRDQPFYADWTGNALTVGGLIVGGAGAFLFMQGRADASDANDAPDLASYRDAADGAETRQWIGVGAMAAGGALVVGGIIHYATRATTREPAVSIVPTRGGGAFVFGGRF